jgi:hypothetical protein
MQAMTAQMSDVAMRSEGSAEHKSPQGLGCEYY